MSLTENIVNKYTLIIDEYFQHMIQSELLNTIDNSSYVLCIGLNAILHIFKMTLYSKKNVGSAYVNCQKAYYCYLEYIEQMNRTNLLHNLNNLDAVIFVYKKTIDDLYEVSSLRGTNTSSLQISNSIVNDKENKEISYVIKNLSIITKMVLFFTEEVFLEREENSKVNNLTIIQLYEISKNHLKYFLQLVNSNDTLTPFEYDYSIIVKYVHFIQEKIKMNFAEYETFLKELRKVIKIMNVKNKLPNEKDILNKQLELFYSEEKKIELENLLKNGKQSIFIKILFDF